MKVLNWCSSSNTIFYVLNIYCCTTYCTSTYTFIIFSFSSVLIPQCLGLQRKDEFHRPVGCPWPEIRHCCIVVASRQSLRLAASSSLFRGSLDPGCARKGLGNNLARKCLERWNAAVGVDEGKNAFQPTSIRVLLMTGSDIW